MASAIDPTKPVFGNPDTESVRANLLAAKNEIEALQADVTELQADVSTAESTITSIVDAFGFVDYADNSTGITPISVSPSTWTKITNDTNGATTKTDALPDGITTLFNPTTNQFAFGQVVVNSQLSLRADLSVTTTTANQVVKVRVRFAIGDPIEFSIVCADSHYKNSGAQDLLVLLLFYIGSAELRNNPAEIEIWSDAACTLTNRGFYISVIKAL